MATKSSSEFVGRNPYCAECIANMEIKGNAPVMTLATRLTSKGQITIPKAIRDRLGMKPGDRMTFTPMHDGTVVMRVKNKSITQLAGMLYKKGRKPVSIAQTSR